jgi:hypothetical protein
MFQEMVAITTLANTSFAECVKCLTTILSLAQFVKLILLKEALETKIPSSPRIPIHPFQ